MCALLLSGAHCILLTLTFAIQKLSLFSCACTLLASPIIIYMSSASSFGAKASIAFTLCGFGFFTTGEANHCINLSTFTAKTECRPYG